ncbi:hypothetical protein BpHYR1_013700 [Brachionus plicatilis]|uniref:Uncharacterized protein n=1 Tax=Brachionus plicatilis TaxID=10195 RepID=A0A3M7R645_BRAPC|nr:hypothetical protein BpHYR1_013700 [Brachionus plicatilis]
MYPMSSRLGELWFIYYWNNSCSQNWKKILIKQLKLGGLGKIWEIDESMFPKVKHLKVFIFKGKDLRRAHLGISDF